MKTLNILCVISVVVVVMYATNAASVRAAAENGSSGSAAKAAVEAVLRAVSVKATPKSKILMLTYPFATSHSMIFSKIANELADRGHEVSAPWPLGVWMGYVWWIWATFLQIQPSWRDCRVPRHVLS